MSNRFCCLFASGNEMFHLVPASKQSAESVWHTPDAVCTVLDSWWWTERPSETCRELLQNKINLSNWCISLVLLLKFITMYGPINVKFVSGSLMVRISVRPVFISSRRCRHRELVTGVVEFLALGTQATMIYSTSVALEICMTSLLRWLLLCEFRV